MFNKFYSKIFHRISLVLLILNLFQIFAENIDSESSEQNITTIASNAEKLISRTPPKLLGIFADGVNDTTNILTNDLGIGVDFDIKNQAPNITKIPIELSQVVEANDQDSVTVPRNDSIFRVKSIQSSNSSTDFIYRGHEINDFKNFDPSIIETTEPNETQTLNLCKRLDFDSSRFGSEIPLCLLKSNSDPVYLSQPYSDVKAYSGLQVKSIFPLYFYIPNESETIDNKSYIAMMVDVCSEPQGQVLIYDEGSHQELLSFKNLGTSKMCNHWENDFESFVSDSNKVRVEYVLPSVVNHESNTSAVYINSTNIEGNRIVKYGQDFEMTIKYFEIPFTKNEQQLLYPNVENDTEREAIYIPNSVVTYRLMSESKSTKKVGLQIIIHMLDIDIDQGDFILIGPGSEPTHRELSKGQIIADFIRDGDQQKNVWVNADSAYIRLVTHNSLKIGPALKFSWIPPNSTIEDFEAIKISDRIKNSAIQLCIMESSCETFANAFKEPFIEELVHIINDFLFNKEQDAANLVSDKSVIIFNEENGRHSGEYKSDIFCQMSVAIGSAFDKQYPMVTYNAFHRIFFGASDHRIMNSFKTDLRNGVKVTNCSHEWISFWKMILPIIVILIVSIVLMVIAWRYQYNNWIHLQRAENAKYMNAPVQDPNEDVLYSKGGPKDNPIFVDVETPINKRKTTNTITKIDTTDGIQSDHKYITQQLSQTSEVSISSSRRLSSVKESPEFVKNLWQNPSTSEEQNSNEIVDQIMDEQKEVLLSEIHKKKDNNNSKPNTISAANNAFATQLPITGLNGTQHESLRSYPRSVLRRPTIVSENEYVLSPESGHNPVRRGSKVQFELPQR